MRMNSTVSGLMAGLILAAVPITTDAQPRIRFQLECDAPPVDGYYASLAESYDVPYDDICLMHEDGVADDDMPLLLYIYTHSHYSLRHIYSLRLRGATWENLSNWCGVPLYTDRDGPPYGNAYGYYRHGPGKYRHEPRWDGDADKHQGKRWKGKNGKGRD